MIKVDKVQGIHSKRNEKSSMSKTDSIIPIIMKQIIEANPAMMARVMTESHFLLTLLPYKARMERPKVRKKPKVKPKAGNRLSCSANSLM